MTILGELDQPALAVFLAKAGLPGVHEFSAATHPVPKIAMDFIDLLKRKPQHLGRTLQAIVSEFARHDMANQLADAFARSNAVAASQPLGLPSASVLPFGRPMINRTPLRRILEDHVNQWPSAPPVVMIDGPIGSGRSHSWFLIQHVAKQAGIRVIKVDVAAPVMEMQTLHEIAQSLVVRMRVHQHLTTPTTVAATPETVAERWAEEVSKGWSCREPQDPMWIVLDGLDRPLAPEVKRFVCALAARRLSNDIADCVFFLLGAGQQDYGVHDPGRMIGRETLSVFLEQEVDDAARALAALGRIAIADADLDARILHAKELLLNGSAEEVCAAVHDRFVNLRQAVDA